MRLSIFSSMKLSTSHLPINTTCSTFLSPTSVCVAECTRNILSISKLIYHASMVQNNSLSSGFAVSSKGEDSCKLFYARNGSAEMLQLIRCNARKRSADTSEEKVLIEDLREEDYSNTDKGFNCKDGKEKVEVERRRKIGLANRGKVPWNKGRKHSPETCEKIRLRTKEALNDPKVRRKMSECPRSLSNQTKIRIRTSLRKLWGERLKWKRSKEKFFRSWAESIANAAKVGGSDQEELEWDSYDKIKREIALEQLQLAAEKAKAKEMARIRAERAAQRKTEKMERLAQRRKEREEKQKVEKTKRSRRLSKQEKEELAVAEELKLKAKLVKIQKKKSTLSHICTEHRRAWERLDVAFIKGPQVQKTVSLADQIRSAKKRTEVVNGKAFSIASSGSSESMEVSAEARFFTVETE